MTSPLDEYRARIRESLGIINDLKAKLAAVERAKTEPIAIVGMACRFPGGCTSVDAFWDGLIRGVDGVVEVPPERWPASDLEGSGNDVRWAALIDSIDQFDAHFFGISPREATSLDPQQRLLLEVTQGAIDDAGIRTESLAESRTGVYVGMCTNDYWHNIIRQGTDAVDTYGATGNLFSTAAGRISYWLGTHGPCASIDTACSSSLVALNFARQGLLSGTCDLAIVGGVNAILSPFSMTMMSRLGALSPDGRCKTFDARANGYVRGEGCGVILIKRLSDARRDGDRIHALILGSAVNQDGRSTGLTTPNVLSQQALLQQALENARISAEDIGYIETHGTGTPLGDPIEIDALKAVIGQPRRNGLPCALGALKTNIGHLEGAAGIAGLIKAVLCLEHEAIPKNLHQRALNPRIDLEGTPFFIPTNTSPWSREGKPRRAGVSSFGISGTNAHVILEEAPRNPEEAVAVEEVSTCLLPISAKTPDALRAQVKAYREMLASAQSPRLRDIVYTASIRRSHYAHRLSVVGRTKEELVEQLDAYLRGEAPAGVGPHPQLSQELRNYLTEKKVEGAVVGTLQHVPEDRRALLEAAGALYVNGGDIEWARIMPSGGRCASLPTYPFQRDRFWIDVPEKVRVEKNPIPLPVSTASRPKVVFIFPGQGSQWLGMGRQLLAEDPAFRASIEACDAAIRNESNFSVTAELQADDATSRLHEIDVVQPVLFAIEVALAKSWQAQGIVPDCVVGHSMGEVAAAHIAGILSLDEAAKVICRRSKLLTRIRGQGAMALVELPMDEAAAAIQPHHTKLGVAVSNGPRSTVLSGDPTALQEVLTNLESRGVYCKHVKVDIASHSPQVDPLLDDLRTNLANLHPTPSAIRMQSTVTGVRLDGHELTAEYWSENLRQPVRFSQVIRDLTKEGFGVFLELSPHPILLPSIEENFDDLKFAGIALASMRRQTSERQTMQEALGVLRGHGYDEKTLEDRDETSRVRHGTYSTHPLLEWNFVPAVQPQLHVWEIWLSLKSFPYLTSHQVNGEVVFPGAGFIEMGLAAAQHVYGRSTFVVEETSFTQMLAIPKDGARIVQFSLLEETEGRATFTISSKEGDGKEWVRHASGTLRAPNPTSASPLVKRADVEARCPTRTPSRQHYERMTSCGLSYGPEFQGITELRAGVDEVMAQVRMPDSLVSTAATYLAHPALLDACFQAALWLAPTSLDEGTTYVPTEATGVRLFERLETNVWVHALRSKETISGGFAVSLVVRNEQGRTLLEIDALHCRSLLDDAALTKHSYEDCIYELAWRKRELAVAQPDTKRSDEPLLILLDAHGFGAALAEELRTRGGNRVVEASVGSDYAHLGGDRYRLNPTSGEQWNKLLVKAFGRTGCRWAIHCGAIDGAAWAATTEATITQDLRNGPLSVLRLVQAVLKQGWRDTPRLCVLTRAAQAVVETDGAPAVSQSTLWGLGRVIAMEQGDFECLRIDLPPEARPDEHTFVARELLANDGEDQIAIRPDGRYVARLVHGSWTNARTGIERREPAAGRPYRLETHEPGVLDHLALRPMERQGPGPGEVEIQVEVSGLNFLDVLLALGVMPDDVDGNVRREPRLGGECAGYVVGIGAGVSGLEMGQEVIALAPGSMATHVIAKRELVVAKPKGMGWTEAATIPIVFLTAYYALAHVARLEKSERILIHAGAGGVGMAAIQWAQYVGAEIFATAGSEEKRALLRSMGVDHVLDSRSLTFVEEIKRITRGEGLDVVLNSLSGKFLEASLDLLRDHGRFIEIGKRDYYENKPLGLRPFLRNLSFSLVDLRGMMTKRAAKVAALFGELSKLFETGVLHPVPCRVFPLSSARDAFALMAQGRHTGKLALTVRENDAQIALSTAKIADVRPDATYLITGGLGGLGLSLAQWIVKHGGRSLVLVGRNGANASAEKAIAEMQAAGATVQVTRANVARRAEVDAIMMQIERDLPPLRGIVHAAGVLADRTLPEMSDEEFYRAIEPKVFGAWNLHEASREKALDFFVMYSSIAGLLGSPGQGNYAAANTFLDALCQARVAEGLPGTSIQWGPFADVGLAAAVDVRGNRMASRGTTNFKPAEGVAMFGMVIEGQPSNIGLMRFDSRQWVQFYPHMAAAPFLSELAQQDPNTDETKTTSFRTALEGAPLPQRLAMVETHLAAELGKVLRLDPRKIPTAAPFTTLGMDSLMSLELRNRLEASVGLKLSATLMFTYPSIHSLAEFLLQKLIPNSTSTEPPPLEDIREETLEENIPQETAESSAPGEEDDLLAAFDASFARIRGRHLQ